MNNIKETFNTKVKEQYGREYEKGRWFASPILRAGYEMTKKTIEDKIISSKKVLFDNYIEMGPGAGTWTKFFIAKNKDANFDLIDISSEMLSLAKRSLGEGKNVRYIETDFLDFKTDKEYDLFFSSRTIEYITEKKAVISKIYSLLKNGSRGFIITKTPHYKRSRLMGHSLPAHHMGQIGPKELSVLIESSGMKVLRIYPATMQFPLLNSPNINLLLYKIFASFSLNFISQFFSESYYISFVKK